MCRNVSIFKAPEGQLVGENGEIVADIRLITGSWVSNGVIYRQFGVCILPSAMEKNTPTLALKTKETDEELRQLEWQGTLISRFLAALRLTARILTFTSSFGPNVFVC